MGTSSEGRYPRALAWFCWSVLKKGWEAAFFEPAGRCNEVGDLDNTGVDEEGNSATFGILEFVLLAEIIAGDASSQDEK